MKPRYFLKHLTRILFAFVLCSRVLAVQDTKDDIQYAESSTLNVVTDDNELFDYFEKHAHEISAKDQRNLIHKLFTESTPSIKMEDLLNIWRAKRTSISNFDITYTVKTPLASGGILLDEITSIQNRILFKNKDCIKTERRGKRIKEECEFSVNVLHKDKAIVVEYPENDYVSADIRNVDPSQYIKTICNDSFNPLLCSSVLSDEFFSNSVVQNRDFVKSASEPGSYFILQKHENVDGLECIVVANLFSRYYLSIKQDYSLVRYELFYTEMLPEDTNKDLQEQRFFSRKIRYQCNMSDLFDVGNSLWLPRTIDITSSVDNSRPVHTQITLDKIVINKPIPDENFSDVIPDGAIVTDGIRNMVYIWGDHPSIGSLIKETVKSKRQTIFRNLSVVCGLCFLACWGFIEWRKKRLLKENTE